MTVINFAAINPNNCTAAESVVRFHRGASVEEILASIEEWNAAGFVEITSALVVLLCSLPLDYEPVERDPLYFT